MSRPTDATDPNALLFPAFCYGDGASCRRRMKAEAKKWAKRYQERGEFPEPKLIPVPPGSLMFCNRGSAEMVVDGWSVTNDAASAALSESVGKDRTAPRWFFYVVIDINTEAALQLPKTIDDEQFRAEDARYDAAYEAFACRYPWGALALTISHSHFNTIEMVSRRLERVLMSWEQLATLQYVDRYLKPMTFHQLIAFHCPGPIAMWVDAPTRKLRQDLGTAIEQMRRASDDEIRARLIRSLRRHVTIDTDLNHREWLASPGIIEAELERSYTTDRRWYDDLTAGDHFAQGHFLAMLARNFPGG